MYTWDRDQEKFQVQLKALGYRVCVCVLHWCNGSCPPDSSTLLATGEEQCKKIEDAFMEFSKQLRGLRGLPLAITSVQGASAVFRQSSVFPALPWIGRTPRKMLAKPPTTSQSDCLYPSCDFATPPFVPALEGKY